MKPIKSHGCWGGVEPFGHQLIEDLDSEPIAVLTRARIRMQRLPDFWRYVPPAAVAVSGARGRLFSVGVGEWPLIEQATFSIWDSMHSVREYAYKGKEHAKVVKYTRERNWYSEELFARFAVLAIDGDWQDERLRSLIQHSD